MHLSNNKHNRINFWLSLINVWKCFRVAYNYYEAIINLMYV